MKRRIHGERNRDLSQSLVKGNKYFDWVITTAFYSSIHFVEDSILPTNIGSIHCKNINDVKQAYRMSGRHQARERLVFDNLNLKIAAKYKWLDDNSRNSRYVTYKIKRQEAEKALQYLDEIYSECYKK
ncbi:MAG: hypothetical protein ABJN36_09110 [Cyclobacteriaceae bacterium]